MISLRGFEDSDPAEAFALDQVCFPPGIAYTLPELKHFVFLPGAVALVAENTDKPAGTMAGFLVAGHRSRRRNSVAHIVTIDVAHGERRNGIATSLMDAAEAHFTALGCRSITLEVAVDNLGAQTFYKHRGFAMKGVERGYYAGVLDAFTMSKDL